MPNISVLFNMSNDGTATNRNGISLLNSRCNINSDKGVKNAGERGLLATRCSIVNARKSNFSGALGNCCHISTGSLLNLNEADVSNSGAIAIYAGRGAKVIAYDSIDVSNYTTYSVKVEYGSFVIVSQSMSDAGFSQTKNTFNGHGAIMSA